MTTQPHPTAREIAEKCAIRILKTAAGDSGLYSPLIQEVENTILRELNLEELLRDRDILDWIQAHHVDVKIFKGDRFETLYTNSMSSARSLRDAVTHEIASQQKEGEK